MRSSSSSAVDARQSIEWTKRFVQVDAPLRLGGVGECEIRPFFEFEEFGESDAAKRFREIGVGVAGAGG